MSGRHEARTVLLTGASTGLGLAIARELLDTDHRLILTARNASIARFAEFGIAPSPRVWIRAMDVTSASERRAVIEEAKARWDGVDVLINNAGVSYRAVVEHVPEEDVFAQIDVNFRAPIELARLVLPGMRHRRSGHIISISSVGGMMAMPTMGIYSASKFALEGAMEALWYEARPWGIRVSLVQPGFIRSTSFERVRYTDQSACSEIDERDPYHAHYEHMSPFIARMMNISPSTPEKVARTVVKTMNREHPKLRVPATLDARLFYWLRRLLPRRFYHWFLYKNLPNIRHWGPDAPKALGPPANRERDTEKFRTLPRADPSTLKRP